VLGASAVVAARPWHDACFRSSRPGGAARGAQPPPGLPATRVNMKKLIQIFGAGYGAKKLGGGCISTIIIFLILYWLIGRVL
jgi:hypothetical protein